MESIVTSLKTGVQTVEIIDDEMLAELPVEAEKTTDNATKEFFETLSSAETNSIAKIRAAAQKYLEDTKEEN